MAIMKTQIPKRHPFHRLFSFIYDDSIQNINEIATLFISLVPHGQITKIHKKKGW